MFSIWTLVAVTLGYMFFLFIIAIIGNKTKRLPKAVYSLALGIHCTSWAFFGTTTQAAQFGWSFVPTYLGVILVMVLGFEMLLRVHAICKQYNISSIAEFISIRYEHSNGIAFLVTLICLIGVIPYIALQLDAITLALNLLITDVDDWSNSISLYVTIGMAIFAIWFGARKMSLTERNSGLMLTIAVQSLVKLAALLVVGLFIVYAVFDGFVDIAEQSLTFETTRTLIDQPFAIWIYISHVLLGICSMFCLPRQFHINFVENNDQDEIRQARWLFPLYLFGMSILILPIALAGMLVFGEQATLSTLIDPSTNLSAYSTDSYVLALPLVMQNHFVVLVAFIGGLAASSSMVIVATLALGNMVANSIITPLLFHLNAMKVKAAIVGTKGSTHWEKDKLRLSGQEVLRIRQTTILVMLCVAYGYHLHVSQQALLVETGTIALSLLSQTFPAILFGIYWKKASKNGALSGILLGVFIIILGMLYPALSNPVGSAIDGQYIAFVLFASFGLNALSIYFVSLFTSSNSLNPYASSALSLFQSNIKLGDLLKLTDQILPSAAAKKFTQQVHFVRTDNDDLAPNSVLSRAESLLSSHMGSASTRILLSAISNQSNSKQHGLSELVEQAGKSFQFNHEVLQASITNLPLGISVIDADFKLVAWNHLYETLFDYPPDYLQEGKPILEILQFNADRGLLGDLIFSEPSEDVGAEQTSQNMSVAQREIQKRMQNMLMGKSYKAVRPQLQNKMVEISGNPLPAGGYITCYADITEYIEIQNQLTLATVNLENRVKKRTQELQIAKTEAEQANIGKTKFLAATSHDLMQPLNAASLFASMLLEKLQRSDERELASNLVSSLDNAESLLNMLVDITKLENNLIKPNLQRFKLDDLLSQLVSEFRLLAQRKSIQLHYVPTRLWVNSDRRLLSRVLQNLLSNAVRYTETGKILVGVRRQRTGACTLVVADTGSGIAKEFQDEIFNEFQRVNPEDRYQGLGLGLTIVDKISQLLGYQIKLTSAVQRGSQFSLRIPTCKPLPIKTIEKRTTTGEQQRLFLRHKHVLLLENDHAIANALAVLFDTWGATVIVAANQEQALILVKDLNTHVDLIMADYHLDNGDTGIETAIAIYSQIDKAVTTIVSSADRSEEIQALAYEHDMQYLPKPIKQAALKRLIQKILEK